MQSKLRTYIIYSIFMISGASALIYQVIWSRWLGLVFGNTTISISIVLGSFMLGLALGSWGIGRFLHRISNPFQMYAFMELGIGIFAICFPFFARFTDIVFTELVDASSSTTYRIFVKTLFAFSLLTVPTSLMGATLPLMADLFRRNSRYTPAWKVGLLYAANTSGAALGIILASFILIEMIGISATTKLAAALNLFIALISFRLTSSIEIVPGTRAQAVSIKKLDAAGKLAIAVLTVSGAIALASEVLWTRMLETLVGNSTYAFSMIVLLYLVGIAVGSWIMSLIVTRLKHLPLWLVSMQLAMGCWVFIALFLFDGIINALSRYKGALIPLTTMFSNYLMAMGVLLPLSMLSGACFPIGTRIMQPDAKDAAGALISKAYAWNTAGAVIGSLVAGFVIAPYLGFFDSIYILAFLYCLAAFVTSLVLWRAASHLPRMRSIYISIGVFSAVLLGASLIEIVNGADFISRFEAKYPLFRVVYHESGLQGVTTVIKRRTDATASILLVNGLGMTIKATDTKMMAHLPMLLHPDPKDTLVICFGMGTTYRSAISYGGNVTAVELVKEVLHAFDYFYQDASRVRMYPKGRMLVNAGRIYLKLTKERYDVITIDPPPPIDAAGVNNLYSKEFYELAKLRLKKGGIMAQWIPLPGTLAGVDDMETFKMLLYTFADVYPYVYIRRGYNNIGVHVLGTLEPLAISTNMVKKRLTKEVAKDMREWDPVPLDFFQGVRRFEPTEPGNEMITTDDRPFLEFYLLRTLNRHGHKSFAFNFW